MSDNIDIPEKVSIKSGQVFKARIDVWQTEAELAHTYNGRPSVGAKLGGAVPPKDELELSKSPPSGKEGQHQGELKRMKAEASEE
ncbi:protein of unknown function [Taphrina deformans PYCC 5710]|uniref:Uncharacterized protein n=1 Tax=Taphrina deformans (strain PYCC 5710 / ATCC 11124 / CBS 356.35 / IMI 108563 / JCM 9778 / NBRC 8474) TaxID=1097556 RepID=R4XA86_TAPDE|nr:protein of unknown function [Taphrina deformans PYCC 5710]|eukprot:CCG82427.1 protein of unknown function [Taphrina deformans PYCC 5710]